MIVLHDSLEHDSLAKEGNDPLVLLKHPRVLSIFLLQCCTEYCTV